MAGDPEGPLSPCLGEGRAVQPALDPPCFLGTKREKPWCVRSTRLPIAVRREQPGFPVDTGRVRGAALLASCPVLWPATPPGTLSGLSTCPRGRPYL